MEYNTKPGYGLVHHVTSQTKPVRFWLGFEFNLVNIVSPLDWVDGSIGVEGLFNVSYYDEEVMVLIRI